MFAGAKKLFTQPVIVTSVLVTLVLVGVQRLRLLEYFELKVFDQMMQRRADLPPDPRLLIVGFTEEDIQQLKHGTPTDEELDRLLGKLESNQASVIALDFFRDVPLNPGHTQLINRLQTSNKIIPICSTTTPPPPGLDANNVGFADLPEDPDAVIRRALLFVSPDPKAPCQSQQSLAVLAALKYLTDTAKIQPEITQTGEGLQLKLGKTLFHRLLPDAGGYVAADNGGFQILLNYRAFHSIARTVSFIDVLNNKVNPDWVKGKIVLIGATAPSKQDIRNTPYATGRQDNTGKMPGIVIHAHIVSEILSAVLDQRRIFWYFPEWGEVIWLWGWTAIGSLIGWKIKHPILLGLSGGGAVVGLVGGGFIIFTQAGWVPIAQPVLGLIAAAGSVVVYTAYYEKLQRDKIAHQIQEQEKTIDLLKSLLREGSNTGNEASSPVDSQPQRDQLLNHRYKVSSVLGSGGFGYTYLADDTKRPGSPKCVVKHLQPAQKDPRFLEVARRLFKAEAEILEILGQHKRIPQLLAYFEENQQFYLVQEYVKGHCLQDELVVGKRVEEAEVIKILRDVLKVLVFVHDHNVIHRDIKPSNLMRRETDNRIVLIDFGAVKQIQPQQEEESLTVAVGTLGYASPEQLMGQPRLNSDIHALGMIGIQALTGKVTKEIERDPQTTALTWRDKAQVSDGLAAILDKMTYFDYLRRYQTAKEVLEDLDKL
ncbi:CHASE2 domain-containing protein [Nostoc sp. FACHB-190]|uniref:CHASE2 domain-containing protein n=1 Tax=Nostoc sp. FACHB-190 TaxID=2692838 RepID=UPI0016837D06|nr:CHASE2 domain-containing serine/threonine-protein kinase [Nostoc sp. FACHB-190]MBD2301609.1 CHASE2 domain-containing protein [Nostoc sp. FACHB-190]